MSSEINQQAILIVTNHLSKDVTKRCHELKKAAAGSGDVFILYHTKDTESTSELEGIKIETFTNEILSNLQYKPIRQTLLPGSNHFPVLKFFLNHPGYAYYWCIEDDVAFSGKWSTFLDQVSPDLDYDFITSHIRRYIDLRKWAWWKTLTFNEMKMNKEEMINSFNPIYRISNKALTYIDECLKGGYSGHHEVLLPTLLKKEGFKIADLASKDNHVTPVLSFCTLSTMRWKPVFLVPPNIKNKLYHPAKSKVTLRHIMVYVKRTIYNQKKYLN